MTPFAATSWGTALLIAAASPAAAMDLNSFRAAHGKPPLSYSGTLAGHAQMAAASMAGRSRLDHAGFKARAQFLGTTSAENVSFGCGDESCAIAQWARSGRHRANMLRGDVSAYGIGSAIAANGRRYWALELGGQ